MQITLLDINKNMCDEWEKQFKGCNDVQVVSDDIISYATKLKNNNVDFAIVSPANSYGMMDGGYDFGITNFYKSIGVNIIKRVQKSIYEYYLGEQPIATVLSLQMKYDKGLEEVPDLIHIPTMRVPMDIRFTNIPYMCMKELFIYLDYGINDEDKIEHYDEVIIPAFGGGCGCVPFSIIAKQMKLAYDRCSNRERIDLDNWEKINREVRKCYGY